MPFPSDENLMRLATEVLAQFDAIFGVHPGFRPAHAKGAMLTGTFFPSAGAGSLTRAPHIARESTPVTVRFSNSTGLPQIPDNDSNANPRGIAIRFHLAERVHTDIIGHSTDGFPTRTGQEFLEFLRALAAGNIEGFLGKHPAALAFVQAPKPNPSSFAREAYFGVTAMRFLNKDGVAQFGRYRIVPKAGVDHLDDSAAQGKDPNYLFEELTGRLAKGPVEFQVQVQIAAAGDIVDDATIHWPADRAIVDFGSVVLHAAVANDQSEQQHIIFDPIPRVDGIEPSADPLLELRAGLYLLSGRRRRQAQTTTSTAH